MSLDDTLKSFLASHNPAPPHRLGQRYNRSRFLPESGNTVVCPLDLSHPSHKAVLAIRQQLQQLPGAEALLFTPVSSLHMTVLDGVIDSRRIPDAWPPDTPLSAPISSVTSTVSNRLSDVAPPPPINMRVSYVSPGGLALQGATDADDAALRHWRDALSTAFGFRHATHDTYAFHMTLAYPVDWIPDSLAALWQQTLETMTKRLTIQTPVIPLAPPDFCIFNDMTHFEPVRALARPA